MLLTTRKHARKVRCLDPLTGEILPVDACDTTKGWIDLYLLRPKHKGSYKVFVDRKKRTHAKVRLHTDFDVVTSRGRKLFKVRWTMITGETPRPVETILGPMPK